MYERYRILKIYYPSYFIKISHKGSYVYLGESGLIRKYFKIYKYNINRITLDGVSIREKVTYEDNVYDELLIKASLDEFINKNREDYVTKCIERMMIMQEENNNTKKELILHKNGGKFYYAFDIDAYVLSYIFGYKVIEGNKCGFPDTAIDRVTNTLDEKKISYMIIYNDISPVIKNFNNNTYAEYKNKALIKIEANKKLDVLIKKINTSDKDNLLELIDRMIEWV
jgi:hypothetical protein